MRKMQCDMCGDDLSEQHGAYTMYAIHVHATQVPSTRGICNGVYVVPPLPNAMDFCSKRCLRRWLDADEQAERK